MNPDFDTVLATDDATRAGLFIRTAQRIGTAPQNVEKDFWVCWTLDALFNGLAAGGPRLLFKGGTSLSKGFNLISRFSEDIDVTVFREDLGEGASIEDLRSMSRTRREARLAAIKTACEAYIQGALLADLTRIVTATAGRTGLDVGRFEVRLDPDESQTLLLSYPSATPIDDYLRPTVRIESGAKSALDPHIPVVIRPYAEADAVGLDFGVPGVTTVDPQRTFWDKVVILHGLRRWYERRGELRGGGQRISRHFYDIHRLMASDAGRNAIQDSALGTDCVAHARLFFNRSDYDLASAQPPTFALVPRDGMVEALARDYGAMSAMIFGPVPSFDDILGSVADLEGVLNAKP
jgi:hypothetical protein